VDDFKNCSLPINYAAVRKENHQLISNGGRLYLMQTKANTLAEAQAVVYQNLLKMNQDNIYYRRDIGKNSI